MSKKLFFFVNFMLLLPICRTQTIDSIVYENFSSKLILCSDSTFVFKNKGTDITKIQGIGDDIITYGKYVKYKNKSLYLYSHPEIMPYQLDVIATFEGKSNQDSTLTVILSSPFSEQRKKHFELLEKAYFYTINILYTGENEKLQRFPLIFFNDTIFIESFPEKGVEKISIGIYPYQSIWTSLPFYSYLSLNYYLKDIHSNYLSLYVPEFTAYYMYYDRFYGKEVKIMDDCTISIEKNSILSKCKGKKFDKEWQFILFQLNNPYRVDKWGNLIED
jgi:hypothetical protein